MIRPMLSDRCLSVTLVHFGQTVRWIKTKVGRKVGLGHGHIVYDGDPTRPPQRGTAPEIFGPYLLWPNGPMDQDATWYGGRPRPRQFCVRLGPCSPSAKGAGAPKFSAHVYCGQTAGWIKMALGVDVGISPGDFLLDGDPAPSPKRGCQKGAEPPIFVPCLLWPNGCMDQDATWYGGRPWRPRRHCVRWGPSTPFPKRGRSPLPNFWPMSIVAKRLDGSR